MGWSHNQLYCSSRKDADCSGNSQFFLSTPIWFQVLLWFDSNPSVIWGSFWMLCPDQAAQGPMAAPPAIPHKPSIPTYSPLWSKNKHFHVISFSHRRFCPEEQWEEEQTQTLSRSTTAMLQATHEFVPQILEPLDVKQEASLDSQKEPEQPTLGFYVKHSALYFRTEITESVITLGMAKDVAKLYKFHNSCNFNAGCIQVFNSSPAFTAPSKLFCLDNL